MIHFHSQVHESSTALFHSTLLHGRSDLASTYVTIQETTAPLCHYYNQYQVNPPVLTELQIAVDQPCFESVTELVLMHFWMAYLLPVLMQLVSELLSCWNV